MSINIGPAVASEAKKKKKKGDKAGGYNQRKETRTKYMDTAFDHKKKKKK